MKGDSVDGSMWNIIVQFNLVNLTGINKATTGVNEGFESSQWATYQSWKSAKRQVRKGQKGTRIMFFSRIKIEGEPEDEELPPNYGFRRYFSVFNEEQLEATDEIQPVVDSPVIENTRASHQVVNIAQRANAEVIVCCLQLYTSRFFATKSAS